MHVRYVQISDDNKRIRARFSRHMELRDVQLREDIWFSSPPVVRPVSSAT